MCCVECFIDLLQHNHFMTLWSPLSSAWFECNVNDITLYSDFLLNSARWNNLDPTSEYQANPLFMPHPVFLCRLCNPGVLGWSLLNRCILLILSWTLPLIIVDGSISMVYHTEFCLERHLIGVLHLSKECWCCLIPVDGCTFGACTFSLLGWDEQVVFSWLPLLEGPCGNCDSNMLY